MQSNDSQEKNRRDFLHRLAEQPFVGMKWIVVVTACVSLGYLMGGMDQYDAVHDDSREMLSSGLSSPSQLSSPSRRYPLFIGSGHGTTGTHSVHKALCELGIPSAHFLRACYKKDESGNALDKEIEAGVEEHFEMMQAWDALTTCKNTADCSFLKGTLLEEDVRKHITRVMHSGIGAINDDPYPWYLSHVFNVSKSLGEGSTILVLTERDPEKWTVSRNKNHNDFFVCKNPMATLDMELCVELAKKEKPQPKYFDELFISFKQCTTEKQKKELSSQIADALKRHQDRVIQHSPQIHFNLFEGERRSTADLAAEIWNIVEPSLSAGAKLALSHPTSRNCVRTWDGVSCS